MLKRSLFLLFVLMACLPFRDSDRSRPVIPPDPLTENLPSETLIHKGEVDNALSLLEKNLKTTESSQDLLLYGKALRMRGRFREALDVLNKGIERRDVGTENFEREKVSLLVEMENYSEAAKLLERLAQTPQDKALGKFLASFPRTPHQIFEERNVSLPLVRKSLPEVEVRFEKQGRGSLVVDTGASFSVISLSLAQRIGLENRVQGGILIDLEGKPIEASYGMIGVLELGDLRVDNVPVMIVEDSALRFRLFGVHSVFDAEGVLGMSFLRHFKMVFDFPKSLLHLIRPGSNERNAISLLTTGLNLYFPGTCEQTHSFPFRLDTGSNQSSLTPFAIAQVGLERRVIPNINYVAGAEGWTASLKEVRGVSLQLGEYQLKDLRLPILPFDDPEGLQVGGVLGMDLLQNFQLSIDPYLMSATIED